MKYSYKCMYIIPHATKSVEVKSDKVRISAGLCHPFEGSGRFGSLKNLRFAGNKKLPVATNLSTRIRSFRDDFEPFFMQKTQRNDF